VTKRPALAVILVVAACAAPAAPSADPHVVVLPDALVVAPQPPHVSVDETGIAHVSVELFNPTGQDVVVQATTDWFDNNLHAIGGLLSAPKRLAVPRLGTADLETVSPTPKATSYRIHIAPGA
jgi:hypothetical protein